MVTEYTVYKVTKLWINVGFVLMSYYCANAIINFSKNYGLIFSQTVVSEDLFIIIASFHH